MPNAIEGYHTYSLIGKVYARILAYKRNTPISELR